MFAVDWNDKVHSAIPIISGTKTNPESTDKNGCCIQHDGVLVECNVPPVGIYGEAEFWDNICYVRNFVERKINEKQPGLRLICCPSAQVDNDQLNDPEAVAMG